MTLPWYTLPMEAPPKVVKLWTTPTTRQMVKIQAALMAMPMVAWLDWAVKIAAQQAALDRQPK